MKMYTVNIKKKNSKIHLDNTLVGEKLQYTGNSSIGLLYVCLFPLILEIYGDLI